MKISFFRLKLLFMLFGMVAFMACEDDEDSSKSSTAADPFGPDLLPGTYVGELTQTAVNVGANFSDSSTASEQAVITGARPNYTVSFSGYNGELSFSTSLNAFANESDGTGFFADHNWSGRLDGNVLTLNYFSLDSNSTYYQGFFQGSK